MKIARQATGDRRVSKLWPVTALWLGRGKTRNSTRRPMREFAAEGCAQHDLRPRITVITEHYWQVEHPRVSREAY